MSRGISPQKVFLMGRLEERLTTDEELDGAIIRKADRNTIVITLPTTVGPDARFSLTLREMMD